MSAHALPTPRSGGVETGQTLLRVADELERVRQLGLRIETAICAIAVRSSLDDAIVGELQQLDAMLQQIGALRDFLNQVGRDCSGGARIDVSVGLARVRLGEVRARLAGEKSEDGFEEVWEIL